MGQNISDYGENLDAHSSGLASLRRQEASEYNMLSNMAAEC